MPLSSWVLDKYMAPQISKFTVASIPDMTELDDQQEHWLYNFILNNLAQRTLVTPIGQQMYNFLRRSHAAFGAYALAREATLAYLANRQRYPRYIDAINHWEAFLAYAWQAFCFFGRGKRIWFEQGDGSPLERLHDLHTRSKHADKAIEQGHYIEDSPLCVWLTNSGLSSTEAALTFEEIAMILTDMAQLASAVQDPLTMESKIKSLMAE
jgi:hypothetical protein